MSVKLARRGDLVKSVAEADRIAKTEFEASVERSIEAVFKADDEFLIWGPASVEIVDKEQDRVSADALETALPQLLKRARLSYQHTDQIVGRILKEFEMDDPVEVTINGTTYKRESFPTDVLDLDDDDPAALYVAGEVYEDSEQSSDVRQKIEQGEINSYSISGEALVTEKQVEDGEVFDDILEMDLSAITLCEEGMNQRAKFSKVTGDSATADVEKITPASDNDADEMVKAAEEPTFSVQDGAVRDPTHVKQTITKAMSESETETDDANEKVASVDGDIATKSFVDERLDKREADILDKAEQRAINTVEKSMPAADLATMGAVENLVESKLEQKGDYEEEEEMDEEDYEEDLEDVEEEVEEAMGDNEEKADGDPAEGDMNPDEHEAAGESGAEHEDREDMISRAELKDELPADVWEVVSEYVGDTKAEKVDGVDADADESIEKQVAALLTGSDQSGMGQAQVGVQDRADEIEKTTADDDEAESVENDIVQDESPALSNFNY